MKPHLLIEGNAGAGKTHRAIEEAVGYSDITVIRNVEPVGKGLGYLPGNIDEKMAPFFDLYDDIFKKIFNYRADFLVKKGRLQFVPTAFLRGKTLEGIVIVDEAQNLSYEELRTCLTRVGKYGRLIIVGDTDQCDCGNSEDYNKFADTFVKCENVDHLVLEGNYRSPLLNDFIQNEKNPDGNDLEGIV